MTRWLELLRAWWQARRWRQQQGRVSEAEALHMLYRFPETQPCSDAEAAFDVACRWAAQGLEVRHRSGRPYFQGGVH